MNYMYSIIEEIKQERKSQDKTWGEQNHSPIEWCSILGEEVGEVQKEALQYHFGYSIPNMFGDQPKGGTIEQREKYYLQRYRNELIQVAAVAIAMIECVDRNNQNIGL